MVAVKVRNCATAIRLPEAISWLGGNERERKASTMAVARLATAHAFSMGLLIFI